MPSPFLRLCGNLVLQVLTQPRSDLIGVLVSMHGHCVLGGRHDDFILFTRNHQRAIAVAGKVAAISNFSAHGSPFRTPLGVTTLRHSARRDYENALDCCIACAASRRKRPSPEAQSWPWRPRTRGTRRSARR